MGLKWHRRLGWIPIGLYITYRLVSAMGQYDSQAASKILAFIHPILMVFCAVTFLPKLRAYQLEINCGRNRAITWWAIAAILGIGFSIYTILLIGSTSMSVDVSVYEITSPFASFLYGHILLALALILMGRAELRRGRSLEQAMMGETSSTHSNTHVTGD